MKGSQMMVRNRATLKLLFVGALSLAMLIPLMTVVGLTFGYLLGGSVIVEFVFDWPGLGAYVARSIASSDFPATVGVTVVLATAYLTINLIVDLLYFVADPRLRVA